MPDNESPPSIEDLFDKAQAEQARIIAEKTAELQAQRAQAGGSTTSTGPIIEPAVDPLTPFETEAGLIPGASPIGSSFVTNAGRRAQEAQSGGVGVPPVEVPADPDPDESPPPFVTPVAVNPVEPAKSRGWKMPKLSVPFRRSKEPTVPDTNVAEPAEEREMSSQDMARESSNSMYKFLKRIKPIRGPVSLEKIVIKDMGQRNPDQGEAEYKAQVERRVKGYIWRIGADLVHGNYHPTSQEVSRFRDLLGGTKNPNSDYRKVLAHVAELIDRYPNFTSLGYEWREFIKGEGVLLVPINEPEDQSVTDIESGEGAAVEALMQNPSFRERVMGAVDRRVPSWARPTREQLAILAGGSITGFAIKRGLSLGLSAAGVAGFPATIAIGGVGGAGVAAIKEYVHQVRGNWTEQDKQYMEAMEQLRLEYEAKGVGVAASSLHEVDKHRELLLIEGSRKQAELQRKKELIHRFEGLKPSSLKRLAGKTVLGAGTGALGAVIGFEVAGLLVDHSEEIGVFLIGLKDRLPEIRLPWVKPFLEGPLSTSSPAPLESMATGSPELPSQSPIVPGVPVSPTTDLEPPPVNQPDASDAQEPPVEEKTYRVNMPSVGHEASLGTEGALPGPSTTPAVAPPEPPPPIPPAQSSTGGFVDPGTEADSFPAPRPNVPPTPSAGFTVPPESLPSEPRPPIPGVLPTTASPGISTITSVDSGLGTPAVPSAEVPGTPEYINQTTSEVFKVDSEPLKQGSNLWNVAKDKLTEGLGHEPTNAQIQELTSTLARENGVSVPEWGITGRVDARSLPVGYNVLYNDAVKGAFKGILSKG